MQLSKGPEKKVQNKMLSLPIFPNFSENVIAIGKQILLFIYLGLFKKN